MSIDLATITMEDIINYDMEQTELVLLAIGGRMIEIASELKPIEASFRSLTGEAKWLTEAKSALQSVQRSRRQALGG